MSLKLIMKPIYSITFGPHGPIPMIETQLIFEQDIIPFFQNYEVMNEEIIRKDPEKSEVGEGAVIPEEITITGGQTGEEREMSKTTDKRVFDITYENPITHKTETLHVKVQTIITDIVNPVDKTLQTGSTYSVYKYITSPIPVEKIDHYLMDEINRKIEIVSPKPFGAGMIIPIIDITKRSNEIVIAEELEGKKTAFAEIMKRERLIEKNIEEKILALENAVDSLQKKESLESVLDKLPRRARAILLIKLRNKKKVTNEIVEHLLLNDLKFLKELKEKLRKMDLKQLLKLAREFKKLTEK